MTRSSALGARGPPQADLPTCRRVGPGVNTAGERRLRNVIVSRRRPDVGSSVNRAGGGFGRLIPGISLVLATKPPGMTPGHCEH